MHLRGLWLLVLLGVTGIASAGDAGSQDPFTVLRAAYAARDADAAAAAYVEDGELHYRYAGAAPEQYRGRQAIAGAFRAFFAGLDPAAPIDLDFRMLRRDGHAAAGFYRMRIGDTEVYGAFEVSFAPDGRFVRDTSTDATRAQFEAAPEEAAPKEVPAR